MCSIHIPTSIFGDTARCGLGSHKPEEMVRVHLAPPKLGHWTSWRRSPPFQGGETGSKPVCPTKIRGGKADSFRSESVKLVFNREWSVTTLPHQNRQSLKDLESPKARSCKRLRKGSRLSVWDRSPPGVANIPR